LAFPGFLPEVHPHPATWDTYIREWTKWYISLSRVAVDLVQVEIADSSFVASLVSLRRRLLAVNVKLALYNLRPAMRDVLGYTRLDSFFDIFDTEEDAVRALRTPAD